MSELERDKASNHTRLAPPSTALPSYRGVVTFGDQQFLWRQSRDKEVQVAANIGNQLGHFQSLGEMNLSDDEEMRLVSDILKTYRLRAMPDGNQYFAASAAVTDNGHLYVSANNERHIKDPFSGRGCGETSALRNGLEGTHDPEVQFRSVYLMSGRANITQEGLLKDLQPGHVACLCGECRENLRAHSNEKTRFVMLPTGVKSDDLRLNSEARDIGELGENEGWLISHEKMYPHPEMLELRKKGIGEIVRKGALMLMGEQESPVLDVNLPKVEYDRHGFARMHKGQLERLLKAAQRVDTKFEQLEAHGSLENINKAMLQLVQKAYREHAAKIPDGKELKITAVILKTDDGRFYPGVHVEGYGRDGDDWLPSEPQVFATGLSNGMNHIGWSNVYMMTFDTGQIQQEMGIAKGAQESHRMPMASPAWLNRLMKRMKITDDTELTVVPVNDGTLDSAQLREYSEHFDVRNAFGPNYAHPKGQIAKTVRH